MLGRCIDPGATLTLELNKQYYLFEAGPSAYYVSRFNNSGAHFGCYSRELFEEIQEETLEQSLSNAQAWPEEPTEVEINYLDPGVIYSARLVWRRQFYATPLQERYYFKGGKKIVFFYKDPTLKTFLGAYPLHWFADFKEFLEVEQEVIERELVVEELPLDLVERETGQLAFF